jgi:hypothetical protein
MGDVGGELPKSTTVVGSSGQEYQSIKVPDPLRPGQMTDKLIVPPDLVMPVKPITLVKPVAPAKPVAPKK